MKQQALLFNSVPICFAVSLPISSLLLSRWNIWLVSSRTPIRYAFSTLSLVTAFSFLTRVVMMTDRAKKTRKVTRYPASYTLSVPFGSVKQKLKLKIARMP